MTQLGQLTAKPARTLRLLIVFHSAWVILMVGLAAWWGVLLKRTANSAAELQLSAGIAAESVASDLERFNRMISWEAATFATLFALSSAVLIFFYIREQKRARGLQTFFATFTHELKTPLTGIRLQSEAIEDHVIASPSQNPQLQTWARRLSEDVERLESQVERTLELARVEGGGALWIKPVALDSWMEELARLQFDVVSKNLRTNVLADRSALEIIAKNIFENSKRYSVSTPANVQVSVSDSDGRIEILFKHINANLDQVPDNLGTLFQRGHQSKGSGIGLYLIQALARSMGGDAKFFVDSAFCVRITLRKEKGSQSK